MPPNPTSRQLASFVSLVWDKGAQHARTGLPWRHIDDAYGVYVSEVMLQQTQVARVLKFWPEWMNVFPSLDALAAASTSDVLERWQGLGYNRRALAMKRCAEVCAQQYGGRLPQSVDSLQALPGIGPATAAGIMSFAYQKPSVYIETNVRAVFIHHFFADFEDKVADKDIAPLVDLTCSREDPRAWYYALLDYGAYLKTAYANPARRAAAYTRQGTFEGSVRQKRSFIVREVLAQPGVSPDSLYNLLNAEERAAGRPGLSRDFFDDLASRLESEGFFSLREGGLYP